MENATKALIMAGTVLISILLISFLIFFLRKGASASAEYYTTMSDAELAKFNAQFEVYDRDDNIFSDIITVVNLANDVNEKNENDSQNKITITVYENVHKTKWLDLGKIYESAPIYSNAEKNSDGKLQNQYYFDCIGVTYNKITGKVQSMDFMIVKNW